MKSLVPERFKGNIRKLLFGTSQFGIYYSQGGEDIQLRRIINNILKIEKGFYVDAGSFHPVTGSNTFLLYRKGWRGINIDPRPGSKKIFDKLRPLDINLEVGLGSKRGVLPYYFISENSAMNSFSRETLVENGVIDQVKKVVDCEIVTLDDVFREHLPAGVHVDFLNIDVEGFELEILSAFNLKQHRPKVIAIEENLITTLGDAIKSPVNSILTSENYVAISKSFITKSVSTVFYIDNKFL